ncbi:hypothetical protein SCT_1159 [Sulfuricella sp. T08]|uniref:FAD assembly factor SdhE n=1 Tax=Sulfuricella sp. T08 TaxID=1632857 RepID=UPI0006179E22|nr:succinate dehydrogenase assembly factor 2 [Sulfuricella sp. T08]GAO35768.1 hypothetical protein SCT_1159 [Sulfuricella sp. T08]
MISEEENSVGDLTPCPSPLTHHSRIRWDCRRGMLELDIVLARFMEQNFERLTQQEVEAFKELLAYSDPDLWGLLQSTDTGVDDNVRKVLLLLRQY